MFQSIKMAEKSVYLEMYIFSDDMQSFDFITLLKEKAKNGLRVRIVLDSFGSANLSNHVITLLRESGAEVFFFSHLLHRIHRKVLVVDEQIAFIGGVNFHQSAKLWNDLAIEVRGKIVASIVRSFARVYRDAGGKDPIILLQNKKVLLDKMHSWLVEHFPNRKNFGFKKVYKEHLSTAEKSIILVTPYFMPKRWFVLLLDRARLRGVKVEILVPRNTESFFIDRVNHFYMRRISRLGIDFYLEPKMNHAKAMIIDNKEGIVGSQNLDILSFELNSEVGIFFQDVNSVEQLSAIIENWKRGATLFDYKAFKPKWFDYILSPIINLFSKIF
jgi:cardiolipin synthase